MDNNDKKTEDMFRESQLMLQNIIDILPIRIFWKDINLKYLGGNNIFAVDAGKKSPKELIGKDDFDVAWKDNANLYREDDMKVITSGVSKLDYEEPQTTPTGGKIWLNTNKVPLKDKTGKIIGVLGTYIDITTRRELEKKLKDEEQLLKEAQLVAHLGIYRTDFIKNIWESSDILDEIFGIDKNFVRSVDGWTSLIHPDDNKMMTDYLQNEVIGKQHNFDKEYRIIKKNSGQERWVRGLGRMVFDKQNHPLTMVGTIQDITEYKKEVFAVKESEAKYRILVDTMPLCIKLFDNQGKIISINKNGRKEHFLEGKSDEEIKKWNFLDCVAENSRADIAKKVELALDGQSSEFLLEHEPGTTTGKWCESSLNPINGPDGKIKYIIFVSKDVTKEKEAEEQKDKNLEELKKFQKLTVGRELEMVELKKRLKEKGDEN